ncbi:MAG TPA: hypothetical protein VK826_14560 [Bacteroidia bacterium]|nr:hypothetical protein [Bacteroidia bacterium]
MKQVQPEHHRLTTLQRQILKWIRLEGGGCLPVTNLFVSLYNTQSSPWPDPISLGERMREAVEQLARSGYVEVRYENSSKSKFPSLYDFASFGKQLSQDENDNWVWTGGDQPEVALTDFGSHYVARMV